MNRHITLAALALLLAACAQDDREDPAAGGEAERPIEFTTHVAGTTRAPIDNSNITSQIVAISCAKRAKGSETGWNFNQFQPDEEGETPYVKLTYDQKGGKWNFYSSETYYWEWDNEYRFRAMAPADYLTPDPSVSPCDGFLVPVVQAISKEENQDAFTDYLVAYASGDGDKPEPVQLQFKHILSRVNFNVENATATDGRNDALEVKLNGMRVCLPAFTDALYTYGENGSDAMTYDFVTLGAGQLRAPNADDLSEMFNECHYRPHSMRFIYRTDEWGERPIEYTIVNMVPGRVYSADDYFLIAPRTNRPDPEEYPDEANRRQTGAILLLDYEIEGESFTYVGDLTQLDQLTPGLDLTVTVKIGRPDGFEPISFGINQVSEFQEQ